MRIKICGLREKDNVADVAGLAPDFLGFVFYAESARAASLDVLCDAGRFGIPRIGVFVNASLQVLKEFCPFLEGFQLHGTETPDTCRVIRDFGRQVIKALRIGSPADVRSIRTYGQAADVFLLDTAGSNPGGNGIRFDWKWLEQYESDVPFFLSGGIGPEDIDRIPRSHRQFAGIDLNSRFEIRPGIKDVAMLRQFLTKARRVSNGNI